MANSSEVTDYTTWRKGRTTPRDGAIDRCPKCGRKGAVRTVTPNRGTPFIRSVHKFHAMTAGPLPVVELTDHCTVSQS